MTFVKRLREGVLPAKTFGECQIGTAFMEADRGGLVTINRRSVTYPSLGSSMHGCSRSTDNREIDQLPLFLVTHEEKVGQASEFRL
jgi:hypothetical protein